MIDFRIELNRETLKQRARELRKAGLSYFKIGATLGISDSTARLYCLPDEAREADLARRRAKYAADWPRGRDKMRERRAAPLDRVWRYLKRCDENTPPENLTYRHIARECDATVEQVAKVYGEFCDRIMEPVRRMLR